MKNTDIRRMAKEEGVKLWQIAERLGMHDSALSRKLRHELPDQEKARIRVIIHQLGRDDTIEELQR